jgi:uncharacterized membrane protein
MVTNQLAQGPTTPTSAHTKHRGAFIEMLISSTLGLVASLVLASDAIVLAANPNADLSCNLNTNISCGTVGTSWQASLLGFPNAFLGLMAEPVIITIAVASLGGVLFPRWFMNIAQAVSSIGFVFAYWLFYESYFVIGALCPWCLLITVTTTFVFVSMSRVNILDGNLGTFLQRKLTPALRYNADTWTGVLLVAVVTAMVVYRYL